MARQSQQGQALRVLASSQSCSLSLSMLHLQVAKAKRLQPPAGLGLKAFHIGDNLLSVSKFRSFTRARLFGARNSVFSA
jgi:hypothetical protein